MTSEIGGIRPALVIFDLDGTLIDSAAWLLRAVNLVLAPYVSRPWTVADLVATAGAPERDVLARVVPPHRLDDVLRLYQQALQDPGSLQAQPGMEDLMLTLARLGVQVGLFSGAGTALGELRLQLVGWSARFSPKVWGDEAAPKPAPDGVLLAARRAGVSTAQAVYVGDTDKDAAAALAAGMRFIGVHWGDQPGGPKGSAVAATPQALLRMLGVTQPAA